MNGAMGFLYHTRLCTWEFYGFDRMMCLFGWKIPTWILASDRISGSDYLQSQAVIALNTRNKIVIADTLRLLSSSWLIRRLSCRVSQQAYRWIFE